MALKIKRGRVSNRAWGDVDKTALRNRLVQALEQNEEGAREAIREVYAVIRAEDIAEAPSQNWVMPHHEITQDGSVVLNRGGLIAAAAALTGARAEPDLTDEQKREAARHLLRHYREIEDLERPPSLLEAAGEMVRLTAAVTGEIRVEDVPVTAAVNVAALKAGDPDPLEVVVEIPAGRSKRGWNYTPQALQRIVGEVQQQGLHGFLGHQKPEAVDHEFPRPVTHWVGAVWRDGKAYIRGVVDAAATDLKRWLRAGMVKTVSIFGMPTLQQTNGETHVVDYRPLSIDWTPLGRAGMPTAVVAVGEMDSIEGAVPPQNRGGGGQVTLQELLAEIRKLRATPAQVVGEMGWTLEQVARDVAGEAWAGLQAAAQAVGEMAQVFGLGKEAKPADVLAAAKAAREAQLKAMRAEREAIIDRVIGEMVTVDAARPLVRRMLQVPEDIDETKARQAVGELLQQEDVQKALEGVFKQDVIRPTHNGRDDNTGGGLAVRRVAI